MNLAFAEGYDWLNQLFLPRRNLPEGYDWQIQLFFAPQKSASGVCLANSTLFCPSEICQRGMSGKFNSFLPRRNLSAGYVWQIQLIFAPQKSASGVCLANSIHFCPSEICQRGMSGKFNSFLPLRNLSAGYVWQIQFIFTLQKSASGVRLANSIHFYPAEICQRGTTGKFNSFLSHNNLQNMKNAIF
ncbi:MAG: hypothetical protein IIX48_05580 [Lachnospiraceae bacterium]|nr:hypothetical protein [Lachnospiraceae bacterium]